MIDNLVKINPILAINNPSLWDFLKENEILPKLEQLIKGTPFFSFIFNKEGVVEFDIDPYHNHLSEEDFQLGREYQQARIEENLKLISQEDTLKGDFVNCKSFF